MRRVERVAIHIVMIWGDQTGAEGQVRRIPARSSKPNMPGKCPEPFVSRVIIPCERDVVNFTSVAAA